MKTNSNTPRYLEETVLNRPLPSKVSSCIKAHSTQKQTVTKMNTSSHYILHKYARVVKRKKLVVICIGQYDGVSKSPRTMLITSKSLLVHEFYARVCCGGVL